MENSAPENSGIALEDPTLKNSDIISEDPIVRDLGTTPEYSVPDDPNIVSEDPTVEDLVAEDHDEVDVENRGTEKVEESIRPRKAVEDLAVEEE